MQVHVLTFAGVGPFAGEHSIDFEGLGGAALFLIDGPTGAGKSTIIDALVFALYGDVAGRTSDKQRLRSSFASSEQESFAEVEFSTSYGRFRIRRTPEYARAKRRGEGTTIVASTVHLFRSTGEHGWEPVSHAKGEADAEVQRVIGLTRPQFLQTVVLPQGEFATFLAAESRERLAILQRIFATDVYSRIEASLEEQRRAAEARREAADRDLDIAVSHVVSRLSDADLPDSVAELVGHHDPAAALEAVRAIEMEAGAGLVANEARAAAALAGSTVARARLAEASERIAAMDAVARAREEDEAAGLSLRTAAAAMGDRADLLAAVPRGVGTDLLADIDRLVGALDQQVVVEAALPADEKRLAEIDANLTALDGTLATLLAERDQELPAGLLVLSSALARATQAADEAMRRAQSTESEVVQARLDGMSGELAGSLAPDEPCPVCGSLSHPAPAAMPESAVGADEVQEAQRGRTAAESARHRWDVEEALLRSAAEGIPEPVGSTVSEAVGDVSAGIRTFQARVHAIEKQLADVRERRATTLASRDELRRAVDERRRQVDAALLGYASVQDRRADLSIARAALASRLAAEQRVAEASRLLAAAQAGLAAWPEGIPEPDLPALRASVEEQEAALATARGEVEAAATLVSDLGARIGQVERAIEARTSVTDATRDVIALANVVKGGEGNALAQPLSAYVVQTMFDEILEAANRRLQVMLDGHFALQATEERQGRALMGQGLGLEVVDQRTDSVRKTATLSGGETFCASLALALGLADTVRSHAGGIELGMLFIDEGFGSLDGDRLDEVMAELLRLRADGRMVGVISHVSEMKKSISERIDVTALPGRQGSTLSVSWSD